MKSSQSMCRRNAFTIIELMVVISIIMILISLLIPALRETREAGKKLTCETRLSHILNASAAYSIDNGHRLPFDNWRSSEVWNRRNVKAGWLYDFKVKDPMAFGAGDSQDDVTNHAKTGSLWPYIHDLDTYRCPNDPRPEWKGNAPFRRRWPIRQMTSYAMNGAPNRYGRNGPGSFAIASFKYNDIMFWEPDYSFWWDGSDFPSQGQADRHGGGGFVGSIDGSVHFMAIDEYWVETARRPGRLWCVPNSDTGR